MYKSCVIGLLAVLLAGAGHAQQDPQWSMYMYNRMVLNSAFAGHHRDGGHFTMAGRTQWVGIDGNPRSFSLAYDKPIYRLNSAFGFSLMNDQLGPFSATDFKGHYAYRLALNQKGAALQLGVNLGILYRAVDGTNWRPPQQPTDPVLATVVANQILLDMGAGIAYTAADDRIYMGLGVNHLLEPTITAYTLSGNDNRVPRTFSFTAGYRYDIARGMYVQPSVLVKRAGPIMQYDLNVNMTLQPLVFGLGYRLGDAVVGLVGLQASKRLFVGYSYDYTHSRLGAATSGSHEIIISYGLRRSRWLDPIDAGTLDKRN